MNDGLKKITGILKITIVRGNGVVECFEHKNLVVTVGRNHISDQLAAKNEAPMSHMAVGSGTATQVIGDIALETELDRKEFTSKSQGSGADSHKIIYTADWAPGQATGAITEAGIFNSVAAGTLLARSTFAVKNKGVEDSLSIQWTLSING